MTAQRTHVVVIGGGYAGTLAANHLRLRADVDITLVNPRPSSSSGSGCTSSSPAPTTPPSTTARCSARASSWSSTPPTRIDTAARTVSSRPARPLHYDYLIYAVGSTGAVPASVPGAAEFAYPIAELEHAERLRATLDELHPDAPVVVVGAGLTGIETAVRTRRAGPHRHAGVRRRARPVR